MVRLRAACWMLAGALAAHGCSNPRDRDVPRQPGSTTGATGGDATGGSAGGAGETGTGGMGGMAGMGGASATGGMGGSGGASAVAPDFSLFDVNPASPSYWQAVSPRDQLRRVSGWYFGHAT